MSKAPPTKNSHKVDSFSNAFYGFICTFFEDYINKEEGVPSRKYHTVQNSVYTIRESNIRARVDDAAERLRKKLNQKLQNFFKTNWELFSTDYDPNVKDWSDIRDDFVKECALIIKQAYSVCVGENPQQYSRYYRIARKENHPDAFQLSDFGGDPAKFIRQGSGPYGDKNFRLSHTLDIQQIMQERLEQNKRVTEAQTEQPNQPTSTHDETLQVKKSSKKRKHRPTKAEDEEYIPPERVPDEPTAQKRVKITHVSAPEPKEKEVTEEYDLQKLQTAQEEETIDLTREAMKLFNRKKPRILSDGDNQRGVPDETRKRDSVPRLVNETQQRVSSQIRHSQILASSNQTCLNAATEHQKQISHLKQDYEDKIKLLTQQLQDAQAKANQSTELLKKANTALLSAAENRERLEEDIAKLKEQQGNNEAHNEPLHQSNQIPIEVRNESLAQIPMMQLAKNSQLIRRGTGLDIQKVMTKMITNLQQEYLLKYSRKRVRSPSALQHNFTYYSVFKAYYLTKQVQCVMCHALVGCNEEPLGCSSREAAIAHETALKQMSLKNYLYPYGIRSTVDSAARAAPLTIAYDILKSAYLRRGQVFPIDCSRGNIIQRGNRAKVPSCDLDLLDVDEKVFVMYGVSFEHEVYESMKQKIDVQLCDDRGVEGRDMWSHAHPLICNAIETIIAAKLK